MTEQWDREQSYEKWTCESECGGCCKLYLRKSRVVAKLRNQNREASYHDYLQMMLINDAPQRNSPGPMINKNNAGMIPNIFLSTEICNIGYSLPSIRTVTAIKSNATIPNNIIATVRNKFDCIEFPDAGKKQPLARSNEDAIR